jgi:hypothetical protein
VFKSYRDRLNKAREIDKGLGRYAERLSRFIWPWRELWLLAVAGSLSILDFLSTYALLGLSGKVDVYESGRLAVWALDKGGFFLLLLVDVVVVGALSLAALVVRYVYTRNGFRDYGRAAFVFLLMPYVFVAAFAIVNNTILLVR